MKLIFLDIDGVLNYELFWREKRQRDRYNELPKDAPKGAHDLCEKAIELLNDLIGSTGAKVVISSSWRIGRTPEELQEVLNYKGFKGEVIDKTPRLDFRTKDYSYSVPRGCEIKAWMEMNKGILGDKITKVKYVILDDDSDMLYWQRNNYLWVDRYVGLTPNIVWKAKQILL